MKIKINLFKKIFLFSIFLIIFTVSLSYLLNIFMGDSFYINRRKNEIIKVKDNVKIILNKEYELEEYLENIKEKDGIDVYIENTSNNRGHHHRRSRRYKNTKDGFNIITIQNNIKLLIYKEEISKRETIFITTSLSVMSNHRDEVYMLNLITLIIALGISVFISRIFAKRITDNIKSLNRVAQKISNLDFSEKSDIKTSDELNSLSKSINIMSDNISSSIEGLNTFVSNASHELKTPIAVINTHTQFLLSKKIENEEERKNYYKVILKESEYMSTLVKDLLLISKLSTSNTKIDKEQFEVSYLLKESIEQFEFLELKKDIEWKIDLEKSFILGNKKLLRIVFNNLVQNALKYSPENSEIKVYREKDKIKFENEMYMNEIDNVTDLFQPFFRGKNATEIKVEGSGLGLSLVKRILELHSFNYGIVTKNNRFIFYFDIFR